MMTTSLRLRSVCVGLAFLFSTSLLYTLSFHRLEGTNPFGPDYHQPSLIARFLNDYTPDVSKNITVPDGQRNHALESLAPVSQHLHVKRDEELLYQFGCLVNKGIKYFEEGIVKGAGDFDNGPQDFGQNPFGDNGWTRNEGKEDTPSIWDDVLKNLPHDRAFANVWHPPNQKTAGGYNAYYYPSHGIILITSAYSPAWYVKGRGVPDDEVEQYIPRLHQLSDALWEVWKRITDRPKTLRFVASHRITNPVTSPLLDYLFERDRDSVQVPWDRRLTFGLDSDEGKALLGTPNGVAVAWLLIHRHDTLGSRDPRVSIFRVGRLRYMIWELIPEGEKSTFDNYKAGFVSQGVGSYGHRDQTNDFSVPLPPGWSLGKRHVGSEFQSLLRRGYRYLTGMVIPWIR